LTTLYCRVLLRRLLLLLPLVVVVILSVTGIQHDVERCRVCAETVANGAKKLLYGIIIILIRSRKAAWVDDVGDYVRAICPLQP